MTNEQREKLKAFKKVFIEYHTVTHLIELMASLHENGGDDGDEASCMMILGESRAGKTFTIKHYISDFPPIREAERDRIPVVYVQTPAQTHQKGHMEALLRVLRDPAPSSGTLPSMIQRSLRLIKLLQVELIVFDEYQHLAEKVRTSKGAYGIGDVTKCLLNSGSCPIILTGTARAEWVLESNEQLLNRCKSITRLMPFRYETQEDREYVADILDGFESALPLEKTSDLSDPDMAQRIFTATEGYIGKIATLLADACELAMQRGASHLDKTILSDVFARKRLKNARGDNPFRGASAPDPYDARKFRTYSPQAVLCDSANSLIRR